MRYTWIHAINEPRNFSKYYESFHNFKEAINDCLNNVQTTFKEQIKTLLNPKFQVFLKSATVTA
ncbi:hypothetical protein BMETH_60_0 [methanotrophic bacterial endosymbiont of Bathymodiolus sp.]|nr:hypothetical protein BMETH_60_0 [methanotrophic bacterial endosymbiont of Bathymodiolus sp.]